MDSVEINALRKAVEGLHQVKAAYAETVRALDMFDGEVVFDRPVAVFTIEGHPDTTRAYAWLAHGTGKKIRYFAELHVGAVTSAVMAVRGSILQDARKTEHL